MDSLQRFLVDYDIAMLRALAQGRGVELTHNRQPDAVVELASVLTDPLSVRLALAALSEDARDALLVLRSAGGQMRAVTFSRRFGDVRPMGPGRLERERPWLEPASSAEELIYAGLVFRAFRAGAGGPGEFFFIPAELAALLPTPPDKAPVFAVEAVSVPLPAPAGPSAGGVPGPDLVRDMFAYLVFLQSQDVRPYTDGRLSLSDLDALRALLTADDDRRLAFLRHLAGCLGFIVPRDGSLGLDAGSVKRWLTDSPASQLAAMQVAWREDPGWDDLCLVPGLECDDKAPWRQRRDPADARRALLDLLARCPAGDWWTAESFVAAVKVANPDFQRPDGDYSSWYIRDRGSGEYLAGFESWDRVEGALVVDLLAAPLRWLGVVDVGEASTQSAARTVCKMTDSGARFLGLVAGEPAPFEPHPIRIETDFSVEVPPPVNLYARFQLERFADLENESPCRYRLTAASLGRTLSGGIRVNQVLAFLQQASEHPLPPNVVVELRLWAGRYDQLELVEGALITVRHERVLKELSLLPETRPLIYRILSPTTAMVRKADLPRLRKVLRDLGYLGGQNP